LRNDITTRININNSVGARAVPWFLPWKQASHARCGVVGERDIDWLGGISEWLASRLVFCALGQWLIWCADIRKRVGVRSWCDWCALDRDVEVWEIFGIDLAVGADNLVVKVLLEVGLNVVGCKTLKIAASFLALKTAGKWDAAASHDGVVSHAAH